MSVRDNQNVKKRNYTLLYEIEKVNGGSNGKSYDKEITLNDNPNNYKYIVCHAFCYYYSSKNLKYTDIRIIPTCLLTDENIRFCVLTAQNVSASTDDYTNASIDLSKTAGARLHGVGTGFLIGYKIYGTDVL